MVVLATIDPVFTSESRNTWNGSERVPMKKTVNFLQTLRILLSVFLLIILRSIDKFILFLLPIELELIRKRTFVSVYVIVIRTVGMVTTANTNDLNCSLGYNTIVD